MKRKIIAIWLVLSLFFVNIPTVTAASDDDSDDYANLGFIAGYEVDERGTVKRLVREEKKFANEDGGHGFAAEEANNLADRLRGKKASVVGDTNKKNGVDREIINRDGSVTQIQDKYYSNVKGSIDACFESGEFRYTDNGKPMQIEVPKEQYEEAIILMQERIKED